MQTAPLAAQHVQLLPFSITPALTERDMADVRRLRASAYSRHDYPAHIVTGLLQPDARDASSVCFLARDKRTGEPVATLRIASNLDGPLTLPGDMPLAGFMAEPFSFVDKFGTVPGAAGQQAALALMKAVWMWSHGRGVRWIAAIGLKPLARRYETVGLRIISEQPNGFIYDAHHPKPFYTVAARLVELEHNMSERHAGMWPYFEATHHPDIRIVALPAAAPAVPARELSMSAYAQEFRDRAPWAGR